MKNMRRSYLFACILGALLLPAPAASHGINGHVWATDGAVEYAADCELREWLDTPEMRPILQIGSAFPDSGYATDPGREYGETAHWEPFIESAIRYVREKYKPPYDTEEERKLIAFIMGAAAHGMEDEVFDTIFMEKAIEADGVDQDLLDPGTDFMLIAEGRTDLMPDIFLPADDMVEVFGRPDVGVSVTPKLMQQGMNIVRVIVIGMVDGNPSDLDDEYRPAFTWTSKHYVDLETPGSIAFEKKVVGRYLDAIWHRLHGDPRTDDIVIHSVPEMGRRLLSNDHTSVDSRITLFFGLGLLNRSLTKSTIALHDAAGEPVEFAIGFTRWGNANSDGRLVQLIPRADLVPDKDYTVELAPGIEFMDGSKLEEKLTFTFRTACATEATCEPLPETDFARTCDAPKTEVPDSEPRGCASASSTWLAWLILSILPIARLLQIRLGKRGDVNA